MWCLSIWRHRIPVHVSLYELKIDNDHLGWHFSGDWYDDVLEI